MDKIAALSILRGTLGLGVKNKTIAICVLGVVTVTPIWLLYRKIANHRSFHLRKVEEEKTKKAELVAKLREDMANNYRSIKLTLLIHPRVDSNMFRNRIVTAENFVAVYQWKALTSNTATSVITEIYSDAAERAQELDRLPVEHHRPLHAMPLAIQENANKEQCSSYWSCVSRSRDEFRDTIEVLVKEGMIPFARTAQGNNNIYNLYEVRSCTPTVGALIHAGGTVAELSADIGGSVRVPASFFGVFCFKPTSDRVGGKRLSYNGKLLLYEAVVCPLSCHFEVLASMARAILNSQSASKMPFDSISFERLMPMTIGYYDSFDEEDNALVSVPAVRRAVDEAVAALRRRGHTLVPWRPPRVGYARELVLKCLFETRIGGCQFRKKELILSGNGKHSIKSWIIVLAEFMWKMSPRLCHFLVQKLNHLLPDSIFSLIDEAEAYKQEFAEEWEEAGLDGLVCPVSSYAYPAYPDFHNFLHADLYTDLYDFLNYPTGVVPVLTKHLEFDMNLENTERWLTIFGSRDAPRNVSIGVQCVAMRWKDETTLRLMREVKDSLPR